jgi:hypothetical protein
MYATAQTALDHAINLLLSSGVSMKLVHVVTTRPLYSLSLREAHKWREAGGYEGCSFGNSTSRGLTRRSLI